MSKKKAPSKKLDNKNYTCQIGNGKSASYSTPRADTAARDHILATTKPQPVGKEKVHTVKVTAEDGKKTVVQVRDTGIREVAVKRG